MADNVGYTPGSGAEIAADDIGGVLHQRVKIGVGVDGVAVDVSASNPMPVSTGLTQPLTNAELRATAVPVSGIVIANTGLSQPLTNAELRTNPVDINATGELIEAIEAMRQAIQSLNKSIGLAQVDPLTGRMTVLIGAGTALIGSLINLQQIGGQAANSAIPSFERNTADNLRRNINVT